MRGLVGRFLEGFWGPAVLHAVLLLAAFPPFGGALFAVLAWAVLFASIRRRDGRKAGRQVFVAAVLFFGAGLWWIAPLSVGSWLGVPLWCAAWEALFGAGLGRFLRRAPAVRLPWWVAVAPLAHLLVDLGRTVVLSGFPWFLTGYSGARVGWLLDGADVLGVHGATLALLLPAAALAEIVARGLPPAEDAASATEASVSVAAAPWRDPRVVAPALLAWGALGVWSAAKPAIARQPGPRVLLLQGNIEQKTKEALARSGGQRTGRDAWIATHRRLIREGFDANARAPERPPREPGGDPPGDAAASGARPIDLVVWPETMVPAFAYLPLEDPRNTEALWKPLALWSRGAATLAGMMTFDPRTKDKSNSMVLVFADGRPLGRQDKQHLTPGGETLLILDDLPDGLRKSVEDWFIEVAGYVPELVPGDGATILPVPLRDPAREGRTAGAGVIICYEILFPAIAREQARLGAEFLVSSSNYGWFAGSPQMEQARDLAAFRAAETRRAVVLASNNGPSGLIGPDGRVEEILVRDKKMTDVAGQLVVDVPLCVGSTPFVRWGEAAALVLGLFGLLSGLTLERVARPS